MYAFPGNAVVRKIPAVVANINSPTGSAVNTGITITFTLPAAAAFSAAQLAAGVGGVAIPTANTSNLLFGPLVLVTANTAVCKVWNPSNAAINAVNATFDLLLFEAAGAEYDAATGAQS
jgi:hypothetical protein